MLLETGEFVVAEGPSERFANRPRELLIDCEEDRTLRVLLVGMLREAKRSGPPRIRPEPAPQASERWVSSLRRYSRTYW